MKEYGLFWNEERNPENIVVETENKVPMVKSIDTTEGVDGTSHILINSDNYPALKVLNQTHANKVDIICIDPPYNTGNEFTYNDKRVDTEDSFRHSKWLNFMDKRIRLAHNLLKEDGIFYSFIGRDELPNLILLCDKIFTEKNRLSFISRITKRTTLNTKFFNDSCDYVLVYAKNKLAIDIDFTQDSEVKYNLKDEFGSYRRFSYDLTFRGTNDKNKYVIKAPDGTPLTSENGWSVSEEKYREQLSKNLVEFVEENGNWKVYKKLYETGTKPVSNFLTSEDFYNRRGTAELKDIFGGDKVFDYPKPTALIEYLIDITNKPNDIIVLDFFAGSGSTAHAVINMNEKDLGTRQSISVALNDPDDDIDICSEVTYERLKKVVCNIKEKYKGQLDGVGAGNPTLKYVEIELREDAGEIQRELIKEENTIILNGN